MGCIETTSWNYEVLGGWRYHAYPFLLVGILFVFCRYETRKRVPVPKELMELLFCCSEIPPCQRYRTEHRFRSGNTLGLRERQCCWPPLD